jgi:hypothetical protein
MKKALAALAVIALLPAGAALADDDNCSSPRDRWQPREAALQVAEQNGWIVRDFEIDDGCYEIEGRDSSGREIEVKLDPATLQVVEMQYEYEDDDRGGARNPAPAGTVAPPQNGLFGNGTPPQVQVN